MAVVEAVSLRLDCSIRDLPLNCNRCNSARFRMDWFWEGSFQRRSILETNSVYKNGHSASIYFTLTISNVCKELICKLLEGSVAVLF